MAINTRKFRDEMQEAVDTADQITPSVLALAKKAGVSAKDFASALADSDSTSQYRTEVALALQPVLVKKAIDEENERKNSK
jgi:hypothetical protein